MKMRVIGSMVLASAVIAAGCNKNKSVEEAVAADEVMIEVSGVKITSGEIDAEVDMLIKSRNIPEEQMAQAKEYFRMQTAKKMMMKVVLADEIKKEGITLSEAELKEGEEMLLKEYAGMPNAPKTIDEIAAMSPLGKERGLEEIHNGLLIHKLIEKKVLSKYEIGQSEIDNVKKQIQSFNERTVAQNARLCANEEEVEKKINAIKAELEKSTDLMKDFGELASKNSCCPSGLEKQGSLGKFGRGMMVPEFEKAAFEAEVGKLVGPVKTSFGQHLIVVTKKNPEVKDDKGEVVEKETVEASHILVMAGEPKPTQPVPEDAMIKRMLQQRKGEMEICEYIEGLVRNANPKTPGFPMLAPKPVEAEAAPAAAAE